MSADDSDCCAALAPKECKLPSGAKDLPGTPPCNQAMDRAIEERYGKAGDAFSGMKFTGPKSSHRNEEEVS